MSDTFMKVHLGTVSDTTVETAAIIRSWFWRQWTEHNHYISVNQSVQLRVESRYTLSHISSNLTAVMWAYNEVCQCLKM